MKPIIFQGAAAAIVTPMHADGSIHYETLAKLLDFYLSNQIDALVVAGTTGESATLLPDEYQQLLSFTVNHIQKRVPVIAGAGSNSTAHALELSKIAYEAGVDALLQVTPYYNKTSQAGLVAHFTAIAEATPLPIILYNVPSRTGMTIQPETYQILSQHPRIVATKEASGDFSAIAKTRALCKDDLSIYSGNDDQIVPLLALGGKGVISVLANIMPQETHDLCMSAFGEDFGTATMDQLALLDLIDALFSDVNPIPVKYALGAMGYDCGTCRLPLAEMRGEKASALRQAMQNHGLIKGENA